MAGGGGAGTSLSGDLLVLLSVTGSAAFIVIQPGLLAGRDPAAVTAVQLGAGGLASLPVALVLEGAPPAPSGAEAVVAVLALALTGTALAFWLFAWAQARVPAAVAGAFVNLEPLVGALTGAVAFHDALGPAQLAGGAAILVGIALGATTRSRRPSRKKPPVGPSSGSVAAHTRPAAHSASGRPPGPPVPVATIRPHPPHTALTGARGASASASVIVSAFRAAFETE